MSRTAVPPASPAPGQAPAAAEELPLRQREPAVFSGSRARSRVVWSAIAVALVTLIAWAALVAVALRPTPAVGVSLFVPPHAERHQPHR